MVAVDAVVEAFPQITEIESEELREQVVDAWGVAMEENDIHDLDEVYWFPPAQNALGIPDENLVDHVREVIDGSMQLAEQLRVSRDADVSVDIVTAGAVVHDVSKLYEFRGLETTELGELLVHPHYGVAVTARVGLPVSVQHIVLSHSPQTAVDPVTLEAEIVCRIDQICGSAIRATADGVCEKPRQGVVSRRGRIGVRYW